MTTLDKDHVEDDIRESGDCHRLGQHRSLLNEKTVPDRHVLGLIGASDYKGHQLEE